MKKKQCSGLDLGLVHVLRDAARRVHYVSSQNILVQPLNKISSGRDNSFQYFKSPGGMQLFLIASIPFS